MQKLKTTNIKGKEYVQVNERIKFFNQNYLNGSIRTEMIYDDKYVRCHARVIPDVKNMDRCFDGRAEEDRTQGPINKTSATENCETSAIGRALGNMGIGIDDSVASAEEVQRAIEKQEAQNDPLSDIKREICTLLTKLGKAPEKPTQEAWMDLMFSHTGLINASRTDQKNYEQIKKVLEQELFNEQLKKKADTPAAQAMVKGMEEQKSTVEKLQEAEMVA